METAKEGAVLNLLLLWGTSLHLLSEKKEKKKQIDNE